MNKKMPVTITFTSDKENGKFELRGKAESAIGQTAFQLLNNCCKNPTTKNNKSALKNIYIY